MAGARGLAPFRDRMGPRYAKWVRWGIGGALVAYLLVLVVTTLFGSQRTAGLAALAMTSTALGVALVLSLRGAVSAGAFLAALAIWAEVHVGLAGSASIRGPGVLVPPALVVGVGLLLGGRAAIWLAVLSIVSVPLAVEIGSRTGFGLGPGLQVGPDLNVLATFWGVLGVSALLVYLGLDAISNLLVEADAARERFKDLFEQAPEGVVVLTPELEVLEANPAARTMLDSGGELEGRPIKELLPRLDPLALKALTAASAGPGSPTLTVPHGTARGRPRVLELGGRMVERSDGARELQVVLRDVSAMLASQEQATQLGRILDEAGNEILVFAQEDGALRTISRGARENLGLGPDEGEGESVLTFLPSLLVEGLEGFARRLEEAGGRPLRRESVFRRRDGSVYPAESEFLRAILDGDPVVVAFSVDVSGRIQAEEEQQRLQRSLEEAQRLEAVGILAGGVAHDFNNLLTIIAGATEALQDSVPADDRELLDEILAAQERGAELTGQLLAFARRETTRPREVWLGDLLEQAEPLLRRMAGGTRNLSVAVGQAPPVLLDPGQLEQVLLNLVANARDATEEGGSIQIRLSQKSSSSGEPTAVLEIVDDGAGMDTETRARIFEPFFTTKPRGKGTGLGLAAVHGIVAQAGGRIAVESEPGQGTCFRLEFPSVAPGPGMEPVAEAADGNPAGGGWTPRRILLVEDNDAARRVIQGMLESGGHTVTAAASAEEALQIMESPEEFELLVSDVLMPGRSGIELVESLRERGVDHPVLLISGYLGGELGDRAGDEQGMDLLMKPFNGKVLLERVEALHPDA